MNHAEHLLEHSEWLGSLARHLVRDPQEAEDLVQETWVAALRNGPRDESRYRSWLGRVLRNFAFINFRQRQRRQAREQLVATKESVVGPEECVQKLEILRLIVDLVLSLDDTSRDVLILRYFEGLSGAEIASRLDLKPSAVRMRLKRALDQLRKELDRKHDGDRSAWHASLVILASASSTAPPGNSPPSSAAATTAGFASGAAVTLSIGLVCAVGWAARDALPGAADFPSTPPVATEAQLVDPQVGEDFHELREVLRETHTLLESKSDELDLVKTRLAVLEELVNRLLAGNRLSSFTVS